MRLGDVGVGQVRAYPGPCGLELPLAVIKVGAGAAIAAEPGRTVEREAVPPLTGLRRHAAALRDPTDGQLAPDHGVIVGVGLAADHGLAQGEGFVVGHAPPEKNTAPLKGDNDQRSRACQFRGGTRRNGAKNKSRA